MPYIEQSPWIFFYGFFFLWRASPCYYYVAGNKKTRHYKKKERWSHKIKTKRRLEKTSGSVLNRKERLAYLCLLTSIVSFFSLSLSLLSSPFLISLFLPICVDYPPSSYFFISHTLLLIILFSYMFAHNFLLYFYILFWYPNLFNSFYKVLAKYRQPLKGLKSSKTLTFLSWKGILKCF